MIGQPVQRGQGFPSRHGRVPQCSDASTPLAMLGCACAWLRALRAASGGGLTRPPRRSPRRVSQRGTSAFFDLRSPRGVERGTVFRRAGIGPPFGRPIIVALWTI